MSTASSESYCGDGGAEGDGRGDDAGERVRRSVEERDDGGGGGGEGIVFVFMERGGEGALQSTEFESTECVMGMWMVAVLMTEKRSTEVAGER